MTANFVLNQVWSVACRRYQPSSQTLWKSSNTACRYSGRGFGWAPAFDLSVVNGSSSLEGVRIATPEPVEITAGPHPIVVGAPSSVRWSPFGMAATGQIRVERTSDRVETFESDFFAPDDGEESMPNAFPTPGEYDIRLARAMYTFLGDGRSDAQVWSYATTTITVSSRPAT